MQWWDETKNGETRCYTHHKEGSDLKLVIEQEPPGSDPENPFSDTSLGVYITPWDGTEVAVFFDFDDLGMARTFAEILSEKYRSTAIATQEETT